MDAPLLYIASFFKPGNRVADRFCQGPGVETQFPPRFGVIDLSVAEKEVVYRLPRV
jgi:hypothetical protein